MFEYETTILPPPYGAESPKPEWTLAFAVRSVVQNDLDAERTIRFHRENFPQAVIAYREGEILGFQFLDYDPYDMEVQLGEQAISHALAADQREFMQRDLQSRARASYEEIF